MAYGNYGAPGSGGSGGGGNYPNQQQQNPPKQKGSQYAPSAQNQQTAAQQQQSYTQAPPWQPSVQGGGGGGGAPQGMSRQASNYLKSLTPQQQQAAIQSWGGDAATANQWFQNAQAAGAVQTHQGGNGAPAGSNTIQTDPTKSLREQGIASNVNENSGWNSTGQDRTGMRAWAAQNGMSEDFDRFDEGTLVRWEQFRDPNCPPRTPYRPDPEHMKGMGAAGATGCVEKPIDVPGGGRGGGGGGGGGGFGGGGGGGGGGKGGKGGGADPIYGYLKGSSFGALNDPNQALGLLGMSGGIAEYQSELDNAAAQVQQMPPGPARDAALARLEEQRSTGHMGLSQAAAGMARGDLQGLVDLEEQKRQANQQNRQFYSGLSQQDRHFMDQMGFNYAGLNQANDQFGRQLGYNTWSQLGNWDLGYEGLSAQERMAKQQADAQKSASKWGAFGSILGGVTSALDFQFSDIRLKEDIAPSEGGGLSAMMGIPTYTYEYKDEVKDDPRAGRGKRFGVMAQDVEKVLPEAVHETPEGIKTVDTLALSAFTMDALKEINLKVEALQRKRRKK